MTKLWAPKVARVPTLGISGLPLGSPKKNVIWMLVSWPTTKYTIRGKVMASPKSRSWWVLWVRICPWLVLAPKMLQLCTNQLVVWFVQVCVSDWLLVILPSPIPELQHAPLPPKCYDQGACPNSLLFCYFHFRFTFESIKEFGNTSIDSIRSIGVKVGTWKSCAWGSCFV
jgi:hypothetical protein